MATNHIVIEFDPCEPPPSEGYRVQYRPQGSMGDYRIAGPFFSSPIHIVDTVDPSGTSYEGFLQGNCGDGQLGLPVPFTADFVGSFSSEAPSEAPSGGESEPPLEPVMLFVGFDELTEEGACTDLGMNVWLEIPETAIAVGVAVFLDAALTIPISDGFLRDPGGQLWNTVSGSVFAMSVNTC